MIKRLLDLLSLTTSQSERRQVSKPHDLKKFCRYAILMNKILDILLIF